MNILVHSANKVKRRFPSRRGHEAASTVYYNGDVRTESGVRHSVNEGCLLPS